ncbi:hypothetical protein MMC22_003139 [Lobaria immixta]|nr:hypothetical protein [Lobaria immixta]
MGVRSAYEKSINQSQSSSDEELQWATDRIMLGDLDEVPVEIGHSKKKKPNSSNATKDPPLRLRGGAGGTGRWHKLQDSMNDAYIKDYHNALREEARAFVRDRSQYKEKHVHFDESAQEPHQNPSFGKTPRAGHSTRCDLGTGARAPKFTGQSSRGERHQHGGRNGLGFDQSSSEHRGRQRTGFGFSEDVNFREWSSSKR